MINNEKVEILKTVQTASCCSYAFLNSLFLNSKIVRGDNSLSVDMPNFLHEKVKSIVENFYKHIKMYFYDDKIDFEGEEINDLLNDINLKDGIDEELLQSTCCKLTFLKGIYLLCGKLYYNKNNNEKSNGYLVELYIRNMALADDIKALLKYLNLKCGLSKRNNIQIIYIKNSETICDLFALMGATNTSLEIQNNKVFREMRNDANRQGNCFESNLNKTITASGEQVKAIDYIIKNFGIDYLDESLKEVALLRLANPDITLKEMQKLYSSNISRAGLKYKLDKIINEYKLLINK